MLREQRRRERNFMGERCWLSSTRNLQSAGLFTVVFTFETALQDSLTTHRET